MAHRVAGLRSSSTASAVHPVSAAATATTSPVSPVATAELTALAPSASEVVSPARLGLLARLLHEAVLVFAIATETATATATASPVATLATATAPALSVATSAATATTTTAVVLAGLNIAFDYNVVLGFGGTVFSCCRSVLGLLLVGADLGSLSLSLLSCSSLCLGASSSGSSLASLVFLAGCFFGRSLLLTFSVELFVGDALHDLSVVREALAHEGVQISERDAILRDLLVVSLRELGEGARKVFGGEAARNERFGALGSALLHVVEDGEQAGETGAFGVGALDERRVFGDERAEAGDLAHEEQRVGDGLAEVGLAEGRRLVVEVGVADHVELAQGLQLVDLRLQRRHAANLLLLLRIRLHCPAAYCLVKLFILVELLAEIAHLLALGVEEEVLKLAKVELNGSLFLLALLSCVYLCTHSWLLLVYL